MTFIYILLLENNKYYVGKTENPQFRLKSHFNSYGSTWTKKYPPIKVIKIIPNCSNFDEDKYTKEYMALKGINNVRGGSYCKIKLDKSEFELLEKEIASAKDICYKCGEKGHFANDCFCRDNSKTEDHLVNQLNSLLIEQDRCFRCHREGHYASNCYAKTDIHGEYLCDSCESDDENSWECGYCGKQFETEKGANMHIRFHCKER